MKRLRFLLVILMSLIGGVVFSQTLSKEEITDILEEFCLDYYDNYFAPRQYVVGTLKVSSIDVDEANNKIRVKGTHTCRGQHIPLKGRNTYRGREFKAEIIFLDSGVRIKFWRWFERILPNKDGYWEGPCERMYYDW